MSSTATLATLAEKLNRANLPDPEPIFSQLYREYIDSADYDGWVPGGIGRVIEQMDADTNPDRIEATNG